MDDNFIDPNPNHLDKVVCELTSNVIHISPPTKHTERSSFIPFGTLPINSKQTLVENLVTKLTKILYKHVELFCWFGRINMGSCLTREYSLFC